MVGNFIVPKGRRTEGYKGKPRGRSRIRMIVIRVNAIGELCNSKPCAHCIKLMKKMNIHKIYYSTGMYDPKDPSVGIASSLVKKIKNDHVSKFYSTCD